MSVKTKEQLKQDFSDNQTATGAKFADLIDSLKAVQSAVSDPAASGTSITFIATISQDANGQITVTKKTVNFNGYQTTTAMQNYQDGDKQQTGNMNVDGSGANIETSIQHNMGHFPTVRLLDGTKKEVRPTSSLIEPFTVVHSSSSTVKVTLAGALNVNGATYQYVLD